MGSYYSIKLRDQSGTYTSYSDEVSFMYMDFQRKIGGEVEKAQIIFPWAFGSCNPNHDVYWVGDPIPDQVAGPDTILEIWRGSIGDRCLPMRLEAQFLIRNYRRELLNDGRVRTTMVMRGVKDLLNRPIILPPGPTPPLVTEDPATMAAVIAAWPPGGAGADQYTGPAGADTKLQMEELFMYCKATNPRALLDINAVVPAAGGGITDHPVAYRYDRLLDALNEMSSASWYAWYWGAMPVTTGPVDFDLVMNTAQPFYPWDFVTYVGGRGTDRRVGNTAGNSPLIISPLSPSAIQPVILQDRTSEITKVYVGGTGTGAGREILSVSSPGENHSQWNTVEKFVNYSKGEDTGTGGTPNDVVKQMAFAGQMELREYGFRDQITVVLNDNDNLRYGLDYDLGDLVTLQFPRFEPQYMPDSIGYESIVVDAQITGVKFQVFNHQVNAPGSNTPSSNEQIEVTLDALDGSRWRQDARGNLQKVLDQIREQGIEIDKEALYANAYW